MKNKNLSGTTLPDSNVPLVDPASSTTAHTPGPWSACGDGECSCKTAMCGDHPIAKVTSGKWGDDYATLRLVGSGLARQVEAYTDQITYGEVGEPTARANARLISAAPDILNAAKKARWAITALVDLHGPDPAGMALIAVNELDRALSKAEPHPA